MNNRIVGLNDHAFLHLAGTSRQKFTGVHLLYQAEHAGGERCYALQMAQRWNGNAQFLSCRQDRAARFNVNGFLINEDGHKPVIIV